MDRLREENERLRAVVEAARGVPVYTFLTGSSLWPRERREEICRQCYQGIDGENHSHRDGTWCAHLRLRAALARLGEGDGC